MDILFTIGAFIVALAILIAVHEFGHFWVARRLGVKVLRFSIGFGRPLFRWQRTPDDPEYVIAAIPLGGYVKMVDEREEDVPEADLDRAFNRQALWKRSAIVVAGPLFNLVFAVLAYWLIFVTGETGLKPIVGAVEPNSIAASAGFQPGDEMVSIGDRPARSWQTVVFDFTLMSLDGEDLDIQVRTSSGELRDRLVPGDAISKLTEEPDILGHFGVQPVRPVLPAVVGQIVPGEAADEAGLRVGDRLISANGEAIDSWQSWVAYVRARPGATIRVEVERADGLKDALSITPRTIDLEGEKVGRIGAGVSVPDDLMAADRVVVVYGPGEALGRALDKTYETSVMMLRVMGRMLVGESSVRNLSGPITIAETAGRTARYGLEPFVEFLAVVSISLGVLNLLPIPVLDGGHLFQFFVEWVKGGPVSEQFQFQAQKLGFILLAALISLAFYVDVARLLG